MNTQDKSTKERDAVEYTHFNLIMVMRIFQLMHEEMDGYPDRGKISMEQKWKLYDKVWEISRKFIELAEIEDALYRAYKSEDAPDDYDDPNM